MAALLLAACGGESVADHIDALRRSGARYVHEVPRPPRVDETIPEGPSLASRLRENEDGRALLENPDAAVPDLVRLLDDPDRRTIAASLLAEIGGERAAQGLLEHWRELRGGVKRKWGYRIPDVGIPLGSRYEGVDDAFYAELLRALCKEEPQVSEAIVHDTEASLRECDRLCASGADLALKEQREEGGRRVELRWSPEPVETACEGLRILAVAGAPEAPTLLARALSLPTRALRRAALRSVPYLGPRAEPLFPALARLLDDPEWHDETRTQLAILADGLTEEQRKRLAHRYTERTAGGC